LELMRARGRKEGSDTPAIGGNRMAMSPRKRSPHDIVMVT